MYNCKPLGHTSCTHRYNTQSTQHIVWGVLPTYKHTQSTRTHPKTYRVLFTANISASKVHIVCTGRSSRASASRTATTTYAGFCLQPLAQLVRYTECVRGVVPGLAPLGSNTSTVVRQDSQLVHGQLHTTPYCSVISCITQSQITISSTVWHNTTNSSENALLVPSMAYKDCNYAHTCPNWPNKSVLESP